MFPKNITRILDNTYRYYICTILYQTKYQGLLFVYIYNIALQKAFVIDNHTRN